MSLFSYSNLVHAVSEATVSTQLCKCFYIFENFDGHYIHSSLVICHLCTKIAIKLNLDGLYIPSFNSGFEHLNYKYKQKFLILGSAHNVKEIRNKEIQRVKLIFLSSIFKKNRNYYIQFFHKI